MSEKNELEDSISESPAQGALPETVVPQAVRRG